MDKYKENFEKGAAHYLSLLEEIEWFDNPFVDKEEVVESINDCTFPPYFGTYLKQFGYLSDSEGEDLLDEVMTAVIQFVPNSSFEIGEDSVMLRINGTEYEIDLDVEGFEAGEGRESFIEVEINPILIKENISYQFYELPPDDETASFVFVNPEIYKRALESGVIPDFMGYYAVNY